MGGGGGGGRGMGEGGRGRGEGVDKWGCVGDGEGWGNQRKLLLPPSPVQILLSLGPPSYFNNK